MKLPPLIFLIEEEKFIIRAGPTVYRRRVFAAISVDNSVNLRHSSVSQSGAKNLTQQSKAKQIGVNCRDLSAVADTDLSTIISVSQAKKKPGR